MSAMVDIADDDAGSVQGTNAPEISVSELANALKRTIEDRFGRVRVRGEISNYRGPHASGHAYFSLKDQSARLDAVIWKGTFMRLRTRPQEGLEVVATGRITTFPGKSSYQIVIEAMEPAGVGALMALLDERRKKLAAEGLFDEARKRPLPFLPRVVGVVTSPTGAVIRDILHRLNDRFPRRVLVWPVRVQGETSAAEVAAAINGFNALPADGPVPRPDVLIVARGGGSLEDLWSFNEEIVVRSAAASDIPLISAIGHETDTTLIDFVADLRAPTPTGAAEKAVPVRAELAEHLAARARRLAAAKTRAMEQRRTQLATLARLLPAPEQLLANPRQRLDRAGERLRGAFRAGRDAQRLRLARAANLLARHSPQAELARARERLKGLDARLAQGLAARLTLARQQNQGSTQRLANAGGRLDRAFVTLLRQKKEKLERLGRLQDSLSHKAVLARGFALVRDEKDALVRGVAQAPPGTALSIEFADGRIDARAGNAATGPAPIVPAPRKRAKKPGDDQGSLF
ncbi:exodeoxyribonuclease VII large subunit [Methylocystis sp. WRRC1]|uniref:exodeoxyribonuclease VII large subunit n=1 Tax=Methylocystis sp. WRRC1 TaxID=1732014 RepID=UPI001D1445B7|nr:exodeoxyribonuclease VII large subunit [Methylocystis sp. WRRC1]MCC3243724.1 exodeoxyribonuclease VII large subunit [Methylocystis sp. WRRC1]